MVKKVYLSTLWKNANVDKFPVKGEEANNVVITAQNIELRMIIEVCILDCRLIFNKFENLVNVSSNELIDFELVAGIDLSREVLSEEDECSANEIRFMIHLKWASAFTSRYELEISTDDFTSYSFDLEVGSNELYDPINSIQIPLANSTKQQCMG